MPYLEFAGHPDKLPIRFKNENIKTEIVFNTMADKVEVSDAEAEWIFKHNPTGFVRKTSAPRVSEVVIEPEQKKPEEKETKPKHYEELMCPHCFEHFSGYPNQRWRYDKHVEKCKDDERAGHGWEGL